jgi:hypothetical protein
MRTGTSETMSAVRGPGHRPLRASRRPWVAVVALGASGFIALSAVIQADLGAVPSQIPLAITGKTDPDGIPLGWELEVFQDPHQIKIESLQNGRFGIRLMSHSSSFGLHKSVDVNLKEFPILSWKWKVDLVPPMGDIREKAKDDQAAQVYVVFPAWLKFRSLMIGYLWDSNAPAGTVTDGHSANPTKVIVLQSGKQQLGKWVQERRNVAEDYKRLFGKAPDKHVGRVAIWVNTQHTNASAEATFADMQFLQAD